MEKVSTEVWNAKDRAIDAQSSIKSATNFYQGTGKASEVLVLAESFYKFIQSKRENKVIDYNIPK